MQKYGCMLKTSSFGAILLAYDIITHKGPKMSLICHCAGVPGVNPVGHPRSQGMIPRRFKRKKNFVTNERKDGWTDRRVGRNSDLD